MSQPKQASSIMFASQAQTVVTRTWKFAQDPEWNLVLLTDKLTDKPISQPALLNTREGILRNISL
jgi:hypothetical protein